MERSRYRRLAAWNCGGYVRNFLYVLAWQVAGARAEGVVGQCCGSTGHIFQRTIRRIDGRRRSNLGSMIIAIIIVQLVPLDTSSLPGVNSPFLRSSSHIA